MPYHRGHATGRGMQNLAFVSSVHGFTQRPAAGHVPVPQPGEKPIQPINLRREPEHADGELVSPDLSVFKKVFLRPA